MSDAKSWKRWGVVDTLADGYRVACVDSLGHGLSDKPSDAGLYGLEARSRDVVAVIDDLGFASAHVLGWPPPPGPPANASNYLDQHDGVGAAP